MGLWPRLAGQCRTVKTPAGTTPIGLGIGVDDTGWVTIVEWRMQSDGRRGGD